MPDDQAPASTRPQGRGGSARVRALSRALELVPRPSRDARVHAAAPPRQAPALRGHDVRVLRPRLCGLLARAHRSALVCRRERPDAARAPDHGRGGRARLEAVLAPALPFATRQPLCSHALPSFRHLSDGSPDPLAGRTGSRGGRLGIRADAGFGLVYLGEHYVIDLLAGLALAEGIWRAAPRVEPAIRMIAAAVHRLEPRAG